MFCCFQASPCRPLFSFFLSSSSVSCVLGGVRRTSPVVHYLKVRWAANANKRFHWSPLLLHNPPARHCPSSTSINFGSFSFPFHATCSQLSARHSRATDGLSAFLSSSWPRLFVSGGTEREEKVYNFFFRCVRRPNSNSLYDSGDVIGAHFFFCWGVFSTWPTQN